MKINQRKVLYFFIVVFLFVAFYFVRETEEASEKAEYRVVDVIDGDTIVIDDAKNSRVRYLGIDTPEIALQDAPGEPFSSEAKDFNSLLVDGKNVTLEFDREKYDVYGRILAHVYVDGVYVSQELLKEGLATLVIIPPNEMHSEKLYDAVAWAKKKNKGLWGKLSELNLPEDNYRFIVDLDTAPRYAGKRIVVRGKITNTRRSEKVLVLDMEDLLEVVIFSSDWDNFEHFDIDPQEFYRGKTVEVIGRVKMRKGKPGIVVNHPMLLRSLD